MASRIKEDSKNVTKKAAFSFIDYKFPSFTIQFGKLPDGDSLGVDFIPSGEYDATTGLFKMTLSFIAFAESTEMPVINVDCEAFFKFGEKLPFAALPDYFFTNSTAILYPYIRAFVSTLSLQANYNAFVLPTLNVSLLGERLKANTVEKPVTRKIG